MLWESVKISGGFFSMKFKKLIIFYRRLAQHNLQMEKINYKHLHVRSQICHWQNAKWHGTLQQYSGNEQTLNINATHLPFTIQWKPVATLKIGGWAPGIHRQAMDIRMLFHPVTLPHSGDNPEYFEHFVGIWTM
jgi:hypothetical protein